MQLTYYQHGPPCGRGVYSDRFFSGISHPNCTRLVNRLLLTVGFVLFELKHIGCLLKNSYLLWYNGFMKYSDPRKVIHLLENHRKEIKEFSGKAIENRHLLAHKHIEERSQLSVYSYEQILPQLALLIKRQTTEIMDFGSLTERQRLALKEKQRQELANLATSWITR